MHDDATLSDVTTQAIGLIRTQLDELEQRSATLSELTAPELQAISGLLCKLSRALAPLVKEGRALAKDAKDAASKLGYDEKRALIVEFFATMPPEHQRALIQELTRVFNDRDRPRAETGLGPEPPKGRA